MMPQIVKSSAVFMMLVFGASTQSFATDSVKLAPGYPQEWVTWTERWVNVAGTYLIAPNEQIADVRLYFVVRDQFGNLAVGNVQGTFDPIHKTWHIQYGDPRLYAYQALVVVQRGTQKIPYWTQVYYW